jgi:DNA-binding FadR family transcriptional regulator
MAGLKSNGGLGAIRQALAGKPTLETRRRLEHLVKRQEDAGTPPPEQLRALHALEVLELADTPECRSVLEALAAEAPGARLTEEARKGLDRLSRNGR